MPPAALSVGVPVAVMKIGVMRMFVDHRLVPVPVAVWFSRGVVRGVPVLVMFVVNMSVLMLHRLVGVFVIMPFRKVEIEADRHEDTGHHEPGGQRFTEHDDG